MLRVCSSPLLGWESKIVPVVRDGEVWVIEYMQPAQHPCVGIANDLEDAGLADLSGPLDGGVLER